MSLRGSCGPLFHRVQFKEASEAKALQAVAGLRACCFISSLNVDDKTAAQSLNQTFLIHRRSDCEVTLQVLDLSQQPLVLQGVRLIGS